jgi:hypothetical protein
LKCVPDEVAAGCNHIRLGFEYCGNDGGGLLITRRQSADNHQILAFYKTQRPQFIEECDARRLVSPNWQDQREPINAAWLLRQRTEWSRQRCTCGKADEFAPSRLYP